MLLQNNLKFNLVYLIINSIFKFRGRKSLTQNSPIHNYINGVLNRVKNNQNKISIHKHPSISSFISNVLNEEQIGRFTPKKSLEQYRA